MNTFADVRTSSVCVLLVILKLPSMKSIQVAYTKRTDFKTGSLTIFKSDFNFYNVPCKTQKSETIYYFYV